MQETMNSSTIAPARRIAKVVIIAPFWRKRGNVGILRVERFVRWLSSFGFGIVLVRAGRRDNVEHMPWGVEISIRDPLGRSWEESPGLEKYSTHIFAAWGYKLLAWLLNPDPASLWARRTAKHPLVADNVKGAVRILSSSPPESSHLCAYLVAVKLGIELVVDLRDGWLDEPLKPVLQKSVFRRWREGVLERKILRRACRIFVTSEVWQKWLTERLPFTNGKVNVLTNGCPPIDLDQSETLHKIKKKQGKMTLLHAGQFTSSHYLRNPSLLLEPLYSAINYLSIPGKLKLVGRMSPKDKAEISSWLKKYELRGWEIEVHDPIERQDLIHLLFEVDGLLLLTLPVAQIPAKLFEYVICGKPILAICPEGGAVWNLQQRIPQLYAVHNREPADSEKRIQELLQACMDKKYSSAVPAEFTEDYLKEIFLSGMGISSTCDGTGRGVAVP